MMRRFSSVLLSPLSTPEPVSSLSFMSETVARLTPVIHLRDPSAPRRQPASGDRGDSMRGHGVRHADWPRCVVAPSRVVSCLAVPCALCLIGAPPPTRRAGLA